MTDDLKVAQNVKVISCYQELAGMNVLVQKLTKDIEDMESMDRD